MNIKDKIKKLLSLADRTPYEGEAKAALLKAKELMIENKLTEDDFKDGKSQELAHVTSDEVKWTTDSGDIWMVDLATTIADNYLCVAAWRTVKGTRTHQLVITGLEDDAKICVEAIAYAVGFVRGTIKKAKLKYKDLNPKTITKSYAEGFIMGLKFAFEEQRDEHPEWALVEVKSDQVRQYEQELGHKSVRTKQTEVNPLLRAKCFNDGVEFNKRKAIGNK